MRRTARLYFACGLSALGACTTLDRFSNPIDLPATFQGTLPCLDCEGGSSLTTAIEATLSLREDGLYFVRHRRLGTTPVETSVELGRWQLADRSSRLELDGGRRGTYDIVSPTELAAPDHRLDRLPQWNPIGGPFDVRGEYSSADGTPQLRECTTGRTFPVALAGANGEVEQSYLALRVVTGAPMLVTLEGRLARATKLDGEAEDAFVIDRFERLWPSASCHTPLALPLVNTRWRLIELHGATVDIEDGSPELTFGENGRLTGSTWCNQLNASYTRRDRVVLLGPVGGTRRTCAEPTKRDLETRFGAMLRDVDGFELERTHLVLMHGSSPVLRFVAAE